MISTNIVINRKFKWNRRKNRYVKRLSYILSVVNFLLNWEQGKERLN